MNYDGLITDIAIRVGLVCVLIMGTLAFSISSFPQYEGLLFSLFYGCVGIGFLALLWFIYMGMKYGEGPIA